MPEVGDRYQQDALEGEHRPDLLEQPLGFTKVFHDIGGNDDVIRTTLDDLLWQPSIEISLDERVNPIVNPGEFAKVDTGDPMAQGTRPLGDQPSCTSKIQDAGRRDTRQPAQDDPVEVRSPSFRLYCGSGLTARSV